MERAHKNFFIATVNPRMEAGPHFLSRAVGERDRQNFFVRIQYLKLKCNAAGQGVRLSGAGPGDDEDIL